MTDLYLLSFAVAASHGCFARDGKSGGKRPKNAEERKRLHESHVWTQEASKAQWQSAWYSGDPGRPNLEMGEERDDSRQIFKQFYDVMTHPDQRKEFEKHPVLLYSCCLLDKEINERHKV